MKTKFLWISLLLAMTLLFSSCTTLFQREVASTESDTTPVDAQSIIGNWYCADAMVMVELKDDSTFSYYNLVADSYAYAYPITTGTYTVTNNTVSLPVEEGFELVIVYDQTTDAFTVSSTDFVFSRVDIQPTKIEKADPQKFKGIWYSKASQSVLSLADDGTLDAYSIQAGYYTYSKTESAVYTISDAIIEIHFDDAEYASEFVYNPAKDTLSNLYGTVYTRVESLPAKHPVVTFPNYAELDCASVITLGSYKGRDLTTYAKAYAALDIFGSYYSGNKEKTPVAITEDRAAQYGDQVVIDYTGYLNNEAFTGGSATDQTIVLVEDSGYIPGFAEGVIGHKMGETFDVPVTFPENYGNKDMAGKSVIFTMTLHTIYDLAISDEEINTYSKGEYTTYDQMLDAYVKSYREQKIWSILQDEATYTNLPLEYYNYFYQYYRDYYHSYAFSMGMDYETLLSQSGMTETMLLQETQKLSLPYIISQAIYKTENLSWDEEAYNTLFDQYVKDAMEYFKYTEEQAKEFVSTEEATNLHSTVIRQIVSEWLLEQNT